MDVLLRYSEYVDRQRKLFHSQLSNIVTLVCAGIGLWFIEYSFPSFFNYPFFVWGGLESVIKFWPLFAWGVSVTAIAMLTTENFPINMAENGERLSWGLITSTLAGLWEELGYRCVFICYAMVSIIVFNWLFQWGLGWLLGSLVVLATLVLLKNGQFAQAAMAAMTGTAFIAVSFYPQPIYVFYEWLIWISHYTTLGLADPVIYSGHEQLFVFGAFAANMWFRDGHKYQGTFGLVNSWYAGMALLYATFIYGVWTAVVVHNTVQHARALHAFFAPKYKMNSGPALCAGPSA